MIDARRLALMRRTAMLVNTSRGALVDHVALIDAIARGRLSGYATDVWEPEPPAVADLQALGDRLLVSPHVAAITDVTYREICMRTVEAALAALESGRRWSQQGFRASSFPDSGNDDNQV